MTSTRTGGRGARATRSDRALVLRRFRYGESSLLVHLLTPEHGRVHLMAKGAYRPTSAFSGVLDLFDTLELAWRAPRDAELGLLVRGSLARRRHRLARSLPGFRTALSVLELAGLGARAGHEERELFGLVEQVLDALAEAVGAAGDDAQERSALLGAVFELRFLALQGLEPALKRCATCGRALSDDPRAREVPFSAALGGRLCDACVPENRGAGAELERQPVGVLRVAASLLETPVAQLGRIQLDRERSRRLRFFIRHFLEYHLEPRPRSFGPVTRR